MAATIQLPSWLIKKLVATTNRTDYFICSQCAKMSSTGAMSVCRSPSPASGAILLGLLSLLD